jgi:translation initiation factor IF-1
VKRRPDVGEKVVIRMPANDLDGRVVVVVEMASATMVRVNLGNGEERLVPLSKIF